MSAGSDDLMLLERVFLRLGSAATDEQLENVLFKFLVPVLNKLSSSEESVRKKVMELLIHVNKRIKTRPMIQLPVEALLNQYKDPQISSFVSNFTIIYLRSGFPRLTVEKQTELVPDMINALHGKPILHMNSLLLLIVPLLGKVQVPTDPEKAKVYLGLNKHIDVAKYFLDILLDIILLPYSSLNLQSTQDSTNPTPLTVPAGMSASSLKRITSNNSFKPEEFESIKLGIVKFFAHGVFQPEEVLLHLIVAASDTRFEVANLADMEMKKIIGLVDWTCPRITRTLYVLFLGLKSNKPDETKVPANTRIRLKLLTYLCRIQGEGFIFPYSLQIIFDSLYGENTNNKLKGLALNFTGNLIRYSIGDSLKQLSAVLLAGLTKFIRQNETDHLGQCYVLIGMLAQKFPQIVFADVALLELYFNNLEVANPDLKIQVREGLLNLIQAYKYDVFPDDLNKDGRLNILLALIKIKMNSDDSMVRFACVRTLTTIFPPDHVQSKLLLLIAVGDREEEVRQEALKSIYGTFRQNDFDLTKISSSMPTFQELAKYVYNESLSIITDKSKIVHVGGQSLPFDVKVYLEIILFLRLCMLKNLNDIPLTREVIKHPCEYSPKVARCIQNLYYNNNDTKTTLINYCTMVRNLLRAQPSIESLSTMIELIGSVSELATVLNEDFNWLKDQLGNVKEDIREYTSVLYSLILIEQSADNFESSIKDLIELTNKGNLETQHGALLTIGTCFENYILKLKRNNDGNFNKLELIKECLNTTISAILKNKNALLVGAATSTIGAIARVIALPLDNGEKSDNAGSPNAKKLAIGLTKCDLVETLLEIMNNNKMSVKVREKAARTLGLFCVGEKFPHTKMIIKGLLSTAKDTKDIEVHFTIGESLLMCCQSVLSKESRDIWRILPDEYLNDAHDASSDENLESTLDELLKMSRQLHPNVKQATCIWLLTIVKGCGKSDTVERRVQIIQNTFMSFLCETNDIIQDVASKGLCLIYDLYKSEDLLATLVNQLTLGSRSVAQVTSDTKIFQEGQLGTTPTGENLTTYKELCSLASDLNKPDLIYKFMHLANHNAMWNSKKGAAFGFSGIAQKCGEDLKQLMPEIVPKLYRYQYDPTPNIHDSMANIWKVLVSDPQNALDTYYHEILKDLLANMNSAQYRVRQSCCLALQDFLKGSAHRSIHDAVDYMNELWTKLFRVMDDHHETTRVTANRTAKVLSKLCIRGSDFTQGKAGVKMIESLLPVFLNTGITHSVSEIRIISLQTVAELVNSAGEQIKPFLAKLIPALLQATGELESAKLSYLSTMMGAQTETQEIIDSARASIAKSHFATETVSKSLRYVDNTMLNELMPKVLELLKSSVGLGTRIACAHFITLLVVQMGKDMQQFAGKILFTLLNGLTDRNSAIRKHNANAIGHLVGVCKSSSLEKLFDKLQTWYFEREDDSIRGAIAATIQSIGIHNQDVIKNYSQIVLPLVFFAMHVEKTPENQHTLNIWIEIWSEHSLGTESGIRNNIEAICEMLKNALESPSWTIKAQAANAVATVANKLGAGMELQHSTSLLKLLINGLSGKTWKGKEKLLKALSSICSNCKDSLKSNVEISANAIIEAICKEAKKQEITYKISALECLGEVISALELDAFQQMYEIVKAILTTTTTTTEKNMMEENDDEDVKKNRENQINLKVAAYETLGKAWPENSKETQKTYRDLFVNHCVDQLPNATRSVQISILSALYNFVNKLYLLQKNASTLSNEDMNDLGKITGKLMEALKYAFSLAKHTRLRKEALNIVFCLATKLKDKELLNELKKLTDMFSTELINLQTDSQPEIKCRIHDIKQLLF